MCNSKSINQGQERENFNVGLVNIDEESNYSGISGWMVLDYVTFFIILLLGLRLLARCFHNCCQRLGESATTNVHGGGTKQPEQKIWQHV